MSVEILRRAASLMRERAEAATKGPWLADVLGSEGYAVREVDASVHPLRRVRVARCGYEDWDTDKANASHIASWNPAVALAVADLLDGLAVEYDVWQGTPGGGVLPGCLSRPLDRAYELARAYLGESA